MRVKFDRSKSRDVRKKHGISLADVAESFDQAYILDQKNDDPEQFRAIGWCRGRLCSVIFEVRQDDEGEHFHLITAWKATEEEQEAYGREI